MAAAPKGKPDPELKAKLDEQKKLRVQYCEELRSKYSLDAKAFGDKKIVKDVLAFADTLEATADHGISLAPPSGTRDFYPEDYRLQNWLFEQFRIVGREFGFQEYDSPVLESTQLYERKAGEEITQQMYNFTDKDGCEVTLRPEMTPSLARMVLGKMQDASGEIKDLLPFKWFSVPQCWRFETTQRGRKREHYQWNMDIVGPADKGTITSEVELLAAIVSFFKRVGVTSDVVGIKINSRKVLEHVLISCGVSKSQFEPVCVVVDKLDKIGPEGVTEELAGLQVGPELAKKILEVLQTESVEDMEKLVEGLGGEGNETEAIAELKQVFALGEAYGFKDWLVFDASVVRGLAYYTGIVWECFDRRKILRAICGGGRYDRLLTLYGAPKEIPCVGFGFGDCVIVELLKDLDIVPDLPRQVDYVVASYDDETYGHSCKVATALRESGATVDMLMVPTAKKVKKAFDYADRAGANRVAFVGPEEFKNGLVRVKDLRTQKTEDDKGVDVPYTDLKNVDSYFGGKSGCGAAPAPAPAQSEALPLLEAEAMERCGKVEEFLLKHDLRSILQQCVSQVVINQGENPVQELADLLSAHVPPKGPTE